MKPFVQSNVCKSRAHCPTCRDTGEAGRKWRGSIRFKLPDDDVNFACPFKIEWGMGAAAQVVPPSEPRPANAGGECCGG